MAHAGPIPSFFLYGEAPRAVRERFLHVENLDDRSRPSDWNIRPHAHTDLNHIFFISQGGGVMRADAAVSVFKGPCLLLIPSRVVHGFTYEVDTNGAVLTVSEFYLREAIAREPDFAPLFEVARVAPLHSTDPVEEVFEQLSRELAWTAPGHLAAVDALLNRLLVEIIRRARGPAYELTTAPHGAAARLVAAFRERVEVYYRLDEPLVSYAHALGVTPRQLRSGCLRISHSSPLEIIQERLFLESKRLMLYSNMSVSELAYYLGFADPAYFSRFFKKRAGISPRTFRLNAQAFQKAARSMRRRTVGELTTV